MCKTKNQMLLQTNEFVGAIHDQLLDENKLHLADAFNDACVWIAELQLQVNKLEKCTSSGYVRTDTSKIHKMMKSPFIAVDNGDAWLRTGKIA